MTPPQAPSTTEPAPRGPRTYRYYDFVMAGFVTLLLCSNLIGAGKIAAVGGFPFGAGILFFPLSYVFGDVLTEVYGYARSRRVVWAGFAALLFSAVMSAVVVGMPPAPGWGGQEAMESVFGAAPRIVAASMTAYFCGEFGNSMTLAKMKVLTRGRFLWMRTIGSTLVGEAIDSLIFYPLAFWGQWENEMVLRVMVTNYLLKCAWEAVMTPVTYRVVAFLKEAEREDYYDVGTDFTPFSLDA